jgi:hypothetical protein
MIEKRILTVNPELFSFSNPKTRKKREKPPEGKIKIKSEASQKRGDTLKKKSILKMIREHQEEKLKKFSEGKTISNSSLESKTDAIKTDFQEAKEFLQQLTQKNDERKRNSTLKNYTSPLPPPPSFLNTNVLIPVASPKIEIPKSHFLSPSLPISPIQLQQTPPWGCLKGGALPTYRNYINQTRKNYPPITPNPVVPTQESQFTETPADASQKRMEEKIKESLRRVEQTQQTDSLMKQMKFGGTLPKKMKRKKTLRRTYKIGRSKVFPRVSVLVSNRTLRNNITTKTQQLKQVPIHEVKSYLMKRGLIKVGSMAPNDVLRKMYESASLICGEVQNHNPENLLYNYLNDKSG